MNMGLLIIRLVAGLLMAGHGCQKLFGWFGGHGLEGTGGFFESLGYRPGRRNAMLAGAAELIGGLLLAFGFLTPLGAAMVIGVMVNTIGSVHWRNGLWNSDGGMEYPMVLMAVAAGLAFTGAGSTSIDAAADLDLNGGGWGLAAVVAGVVVGLAVLATRHVEPPPEEQVRARGEVDTTITTRESTPR